MECDGVPFPHVFIEIHGPYGESYKVNYVNRHSSGGLSLVFKKRPSMVINKASRNERIKYWENAFLTVKFQEQGIYGNPINLGQTTIALSNLRQGIRSLPLCDRSNTQKGVASLLVNVKYFSQIKNNIKKFIFVFINLILDELNDPQEKRSR